MSPQERERLVDAAIEALKQESLMAPEGRPHSTARQRVMTRLGSYIQASGRPLYLASELPVLYPGEPPFAPDVLAIQDVPDPGEDDTRSSWSVAQEGRGLDFVLEITWGGDRDKDLVSNVARYARLGIPEYFVYDRRRQRLYGYRLGFGARGYSSLTPVEGLLRSAVLGLELGVARGRLRFYYAGGAEIPDPDERIARLDGLILERETRIEDEIALRLAETARADAETARADAEAARADALAAQVAELQARLRERT